MADLWQQVRALRARAHAELGDCPAPLREARLLHAVLAGIPIGILDGDLLAGDFGPAWGEVETVSLPPAPGLPPAPDGPLWQLLDRWHLRAGYTLAHTTVDYPLVLQQGLAAIAAGARERNEHDSVPERCLQREAMALALEAVVAWAERFADLAEEQGQAELAARCRRVPREPARDMAEAMQALWFVHAAVGLSELSQASLSLGRLDQYAYSYFAAAGPARSRQIGRAHV